MGDDPYTILGVSRDASQDDIRKAYRKQAFKCHPDKSKSPTAQDEFRRVVAAYDILSNPKRKETYDRTGECNLFNTGNTQRDDLFNAFATDTANNFEFVFSKIFKFKDFGEPMGRPTPPLVITIPISLSLVLKGGEINITYERNVICKLCYGTGEREPKKCDMCAGSGVTVERGRGYVIRATCVLCEGNRFTHEAKGGCTSCGGSGKTAENVKKKLRAAPGLKEGETMKLAESGHETRSGFGDLTLIVKVTRDKNYSVNGDDLITTMRVKPIEAICGYRRELVLPGGERLVLATNRPMSLGGLAKVEGKGIPPKGDLYVNIVTTDLPDEDKNKLCNMLLGRDHRAVDITGITRLTEVRKH